MEKTITAERIRDLLDQNEMKQKELAKKAGVTEVSMSRYMTGQRTPTGDQLKRIAMALHTTTDYLLGNESNENDSAFMFNETQRLIARSAGKWSPEQKTELVTALFAANS